MFGSPPINHQPRDIHPHQRARLHRGYKRFDAAGIPELARSIQLRIVEREARRQIRVRMPDLVILPRDFQRRSPRLLR